MKKIEIGYTPSDNKSNMSGYNSRLVDDGNVPGVANQLRTELSEQLGTALGPWKFNEESKEWFTEQVKDKEGKTVTQVSGYCRIGSVA